MFQYIQQQQTTMNNSVDGEESFSQSDNESEQIAKDYGSVEYWEHRYEKRKGERYDWLENYEALENIIQIELKGDKNKRILNVGCGNAQIQDKLYEKGYHHIVNNDFSKVVIDQMEKIRKTKGYQLMQYDLMDVTDMSYPNKSFDLVVDKSTIDALLCSDTPYISTAKMLQEIERVLKDDGIYVAISYGSPHTRTTHLTREHISFSVEIKEVEKEVEEGKVTHYIYICRKKPDKVERSEEWRKNFYQELEKLEKEENY